MKRHVAVLVGHDDLVEVPEGSSFTLFPVDRTAQVERADDHVLSRCDKRTTVGRAEHVVCRQHEDTRLGLCFGGQGQVNRHLVTVEVGVERGADQRVQLNCLALDQHRLEGLNAETVERRCSVEEHRVFLDDVVENVPHLRLATLDHTFGRLDVLRHLGVDEALHDKRLEQFERHQLRQTALVQLQRRADHDDRTARVVDALTEQVLTESTLLALQHVGKALERTVARSGDRTTTASVVEQCVDRFLEHPLLVVHDDLGCTKIEQSLQAIVAVDHTTVEVVEIGRRETATVELDHGAQLGRDHRDDVENHGAWVVDPIATLVATVEGGHDLEALDRLLFPLCGERLLPFDRVDLGPKLDLFVVEIDDLDEMCERSRAHAAFEVVGVANVHLAPQHLIFDDLSGERALELVERAGEHVDFHLIALAGRRQVLVDGALAGFDLGVLRLFLLHLCDLGFEIFVDPSELEFHFLLEFLTLSQHFGFEVGKIGIASFFVDRGDEVRGEVDDLFELLGLQLFASFGSHEEVGEPGAGAAEVPDVHNGSGEFDVGHPLATDLRTGDLDATTLADDSLEAHALVLAAVALPVLGRTEDLLAEQAVFLGLERAVVDGFGLLDLTVGPHADGVRGSQTDSDLIKVIYVEQRESLSSLLRVCESLSGAVELSVLVSEPILGSAECY